jgi:hypothetical protein
MKIEQQQTRKLVRIGELVERNEGQQARDHRRGWGAARRPIQTLELDLQGRLWFFISAS